jgi:hypothetical protein
MKQWGSGKFSNGNTRHSAGKYSLHLWEKQAEEKMVFHLKEQVYFV